MVFPETAFFALTLPFALMAAWTDLRYMRISNKLNIWLFVAFLASGLVLLPLGDYGLRLGIAAAALVLGFVLNAVGAMGGGDAKYITAMIPFVAPGDLVPFLFIMSLCLLAAVTVHRIARAIPAMRRATPDWVSWNAGRRFPMGLGLSGTLSFYLALKAFNLPVLLG